MVENLEFGQYHNRARVHMIRSAGIKRLCGWWLWLANAMVTEGWPHSPATFCVQTMLPQTDSSISVWLSSGWTDQARTCFSLFFFGLPGRRVTSSKRSMPESERQWRHQHLPGKMRDFSTRCARSSCTKIGRPLWKKTLGAALSLFNFSMKIKMFWPQCFFSFSPWYRTWYYILYFWRCRT